MAGQDLWLEILLLASKNESDWRNFLNCVQKNYVRIELANMLK